MVDNSSINFLKSSLHYPPDCINSGAMDLSRKSILIFGGEITQVPELAYGYTRMIATTLHKYEITDGLDIYTGYYKFKKRNPMVDRWQLFKKHRGDLKYFPPFFREVEYENGILHLTEPNYIKDIYNFAIKPRLFHKGNSRVSHAKAVKNMRNLVIYTHCHGAYVARMLENHMTESMEHYYSAEEICDIQSQLFIINHAPFAPLENQRFSALSFVSASDGQLSYFNLFDYKMKNAPHKFQPAFFGEEFGNIMVANTLKFDPELEHSEMGMFWSEAGNIDLTENGKIYFAAQRNALLGGVRAMIDNQPIPGIPELINTEFADYQSLIKRASQIQNELEF